MPNGLLQLTPNPPPPLHRGIYHTIWVLVLINDPVMMSLKGSNNVIVYVLSLKTIYILLPYLNITDLYKHTDVETLLMNIQT